MLFYFNSFFHSVFFVTIFTLLCWGQTSIALQTEPGAVMSEATANTNQTPAVTPPTTSIVQTKIEPNTWDRQSIEAIVKDVLASEQYLTKQQHERNSKKDGHQTSMVTRALAMGTVVFLMAHFLGYKHTLGIRPLQYFNCDCPLLDWPIAVIVSSMVLYHASWAAVKVYHPVVEMFREFFISDDDDDTTVPSERLILEIVKRWPEFEKIIAPAYHEKFERLYTLYKNGGESAIKIEAQSLAISEK